LAVRRSGGVEGSRGPKKGLSDFFASTHAG
jgi:hypothetical protein